MLNSQRLLLLVPLVPAVAFLFIGGPSGFELPSMRYLWNMGHLALFALVTLFWHSYHPVRSRLQAFRFLGAVLIISLIIETLQMSIGRSFSLMDLLRNLIGAWIVLLFINRSMIPAVVSVTLGAALVIDLTGLVRTGWLDWQIQTRAPVIENFENPTASRRWERQFEAESAIVSEGQLSGAVTFRPSRFATFKLRYPLKDWRGYDTFSYDVFNPSAELIRLSLRIHDRNHEREGNYNFQDRFNTSLELPPGWNTIQIPIHEIATAPADRRMDLSAIVEVQWFMVAPTESRTLYFDNIRLIKNDR